MRVARVPQQITHSSSGSAAEAVLAVLEARNVKSGVSSVGPFRRL